MKKNVFFLSIALLTICFSSCEKSESLTPNEDRIEGATGDNPNPGNDLLNGGNNGGGSTNGLPTDFRASTAENKRAALLEDFTGVRCGFCPDGHLVAKAAKSALGADKFIVLAVHAGSYADPRPGWANFTTPYGQSLVAQADVAGFPAGTVNRFPATSLGVTPQRSGSAMSRNHWERAARAVIAKDAPLNIGADATMSGNELTVDVDIFYTDDVTETNKINVALVQDGLVSKQSGGGNSYVQDHVLRHFLTGQWGEEITESTSTGDFVRKSYTYTVPADYNGTDTEGGGAVVINDLKVVVFVTKENTEVLNVIELDVK